ncbi:MAG: hypothetical protein U1F98_10800 [Verrucomicrobiota bacterium]
MRRLKLPPQILRLVIVTLAIVGSYVAARTVLTPVSFHQYGWFRGDALEEIASSRQPSYAGRLACDECHSDEVARLAKGDHRTISCESCHGPARAHADNPDIKLYKLTDADCLQCHESNPSRPAFLKQITVQDHYRGQRCIDCHVAHQPAEVP